MANTNPVVTITMENGDVMKAELYPEIAPKTDFRDRPLDDQQIKSMTVETFGVDYPEPEKC